MQTVTTQKVQTVTTQQMKEIDRKAIEEIGISSILLMETAAGHIVKEALALIDASGKNYSDTSIGILCGSGNNGGDGVAAARFLMEKGCSVRCYMLGSHEKMTADCIEMEKRLTAAGGILLEKDAVITDMDWLLECDIIIDALFGFGLSRNLEGHYKEAVNLINASKASIVAADIPSGLNGNTGQVMGAAVAAEVTVTFTRAKQGFYLEEGPAHTGRIVVADIGIPKELLD